MRGATKKALPHQRGNPIGDALRNREPAQYVPHIRSNWGIFTDVPNKASGRTKGLDQGAQLVQGAILMGLPLGLIGRLDRVLRSAARLIGHIRKYSPVTAYMRDVLRWLPVSQRISYRVAALVWQCLLGSASHTYLIFTVRFLTRSVVGPLILSGEGGKLLSSGPIPQSGSAGPSQLLLDPPFRMDSRWTCACCPRTTLLCFTSC